MSVLVKNIKNLINLGLDRCGYRLINNRPPLSQPTLAAGLRRLAGRRLDIATLIDVGAADGGWTRAFVAAVPKCSNLLLIEAQSVHQPALARFQADFPHAQIVMAAAGPTRGEIWFEAANPWGGLAAEKPDDREGRWIRVPQTTLDHEVNTRQLPGPYLIKLDTHGYELPILKGATATLAQTAALIVECYNFDMAPGAVRFPAFCQHMESLGFRCLDLWDPLYRASDHALWQFDLLFVRTDRPEFLAPVHPQAKPPASF
ncbi:MAG: FkbM family methyltransferase [Bryobacteraceae bacterium]|jgi:FkbM family methyltransferase